jgi:cellulose biosynthesis protein BcsQ
MIEQASKNIWSDLLLYLPIVQEREEIFERDLCQVLIPLLEGMGEVSDIVLIDTVDMSKESTQKILEAADVIVVNLGQDMNVIENYFQSHKLLISKTVFLIGNYHSNSRINLKNISRKYHINRNQIAVIPNNIEFQEALSYGKVVEFMICNRECHTGDYNYPFMKEVQKAASMILYAMERLKEGRCEDCFG